LWQLQLKVKLNFNTNLPILGLECSSGIGKATALRFAAEGCKVIATDVNLALLKELEGIDGSIKTQTNWYILHDILQITIWRHPGQKAGCYRRSRYSTTGKRSRSGWYSLQLCWVIKLKILHPKSLLNSFSLRKKGLFITDPFLNAVMQIGKLTSTSMQNLCSEWQKPFFLRLVFITYNPILKSEFEPLISFSRWFPKEMG